MTNPEYLYNAEEQLTGVGIQYVFVSKGEKDIIKVVEYSYVQPFLHGHIYNLGFGDYDPENDRVLDDPVSNNGDQYRVFNTVLNTIPKFFHFFPTAIMVVQGSDSKDEFIDQCKLSCKKTCKEGGCSKANRRIELYRRYVNKNFEILSEDYIFYGGIKDVENQIDIEPYQVGKSYDSVLVRKK